MKRTVGRNVIRVIAILYGLLGVVLLCGAGYSVWEMFREGTHWEWFVTLCLLSGLYLLYIVFLVWFRYSPRAIRHLCKPVGYWLMCQSVNWLADNGGLWMFTLAILPALVGVQFLNQFASSMLNGRLFPPRESAG
ncbi:MAG: hypothetical protein ACLP0A_16025 [Verrucomicrobiia bacterium]